MQFLTKGMQLSNESFNEDSSLNITLEQLTTERFSSSSLIDKTVCIADDEDTKSIKFVKTGLLKTMIMGEKVKIEEKYEKPINYVPVCNIFIGTNPPLNFGDMTEAMRRRFIVLNFTATFSKEKGNKIEHIENILCKEENINYIFSKAMFYLSKTLKNDDFSVTKRIREDTDEFLEEYNNAKEFLDYHISNGGKLEVDTRELYNDYAEWCKDNHEEADKKNIFGQHIKALCEKAGIDEKHYKVRIMRNRIRKEYYHLPGYVEGSFYDTTVTFEDLYKLIKTDQDRTVLYDFCNSELGFFNGPFDYLDKIDTDFLNLLEAEREFKNRWPSGIIGVVANYVLNSLPVKS